MGEQHSHGHVIGVGNQKGGTGKSTNTVHLAAALGLRGYRCLIVDLDPAAGATKHLGVPDNSFSGTLELLTREETIAGLAISERMPVGVHLVAARPELSGLDKLLSKYADHTSLLDRALAEARRHYDFVFLDTCPFAEFATTVAAYSSADWFLLSAFPHPLSLGGLTEAFKDIADVRRRRNAGLEVLGVIFCSVDGRATRLREQLDALVGEAVPGRRFDTVVSQAVILPEASGRGRTVFQYPKFFAIPAAQQYLRLSVEVEHRIRFREEFLRGQLPPPDYRAIMGILPGPDRMMLLPSVANG